LAGALGAHSAQASRFTFVCGKRFAGDGVAAVLRKLLAGTMHMSNRSAHDIFNEFVVIIDKAAASKRIYDVPEAAEKAGMAGGETERGLSQRWKYTYTDDEGQTVEVNCRWWDQSKAFSTQPDMHVMQVLIASVTPPLSYERRYEE
jgi:hypothetical protein